MTKLFSIINSYSLFPVLEQDLRHTTVGNKTISPNGEMLNNNIPQSNLPIINGR
jgi:hypothetical protein